MDKSNTWKIVKSEPGPDLKLFRARFDHIQNPRNQAIERMVILEGADSVNAVPVTPEQEIIFVRQYRVGIGKETLELPGGLVDPGEDLRSAIMRELAEETGYTSTTWTPLGRVASNPVFMDNYIHHWAAHDVTWHNPQRLDDGEAIVLERYPVQEAERMLQAGKFLHPHTISCLYRYFQVFPVPPH